MAAHFDTTGESLSLAAATRSGSWSFTALIQLAVDRNDYSGFGPVFDSGGAYYFGLGSDNDGTTVCIFDGDTNPLGTNTGTGGKFTNMSPGATWYFVATSYNTSTGAEMLCFGVGESGSSVGVRSTTRSTGKTGSAIMWIGNNTFGNLWNGAVKQVRIWNTALTQAEIEAEWASPTAIVKTGAWAYYPLGANANDSSGNARHLTVNGTVTFDATGATGSGAITGRADTAAGSGTASAPTANRTGSGFITGRRDTAAAAGTTNSPRTGSGAVAGRPDTSSGAGLNAALSFYSDDFDRANSTPTGVGLGPNWVNSTNTWYINGGHATKVPVDHYVRWATALPGEDQYVEVDIPWDRTTDYMWLHLRAANNTVVDGPPFGVYEAGINTTEGGNNSGRCEMGIIHADGSYTVLGRANTVAATPPRAIGRLRLEAVGNRIRFYVDGILNLEAFDSELHGHYVGLNCGIASIPGNAYYDNFATGLVVPPSGAVVERRDTVAGVGSILGSNRSGSGAIVEAHDVALSFTPHRPSSISGRKLLDQTGGVYLARPMSSWGMASHLTNAEITQALTDVNANGFNGVTVWCGGVEDRGGVGWAGNKYKNAAGQNYWTGTPWQSTLGPAWVTVDWIVAECARLGLVLHFSFCHGWGGFGCAAQWNAASDANMFDAGVAIATRYLASPNIVWHVMFDDPIGPSGGTGAGAKIRKLFDGINATEGASTRPVRWCETDNGKSTNQQGWYDPTGASTSTRFSINCLYTWGGSAAEAAEGVYGETSGPTGDCEPVYVGNTDPSAYGGDRQQLRERPYSVFLEGGSIINWGHEAFWPMGAEKLFPVGGMTWEGVVSDPATLDAKYCWSLIDAYCKDVAWAPTSSFVTSGEASGGTKAAAGASTTAALAYFPSNRAIQVDTTILTGIGNVRLRWYDPATGTFATIVDSEAKQAGRVVTLPAARVDSTRDYVLVADAPGGGGAPGAAGGFIGTTPITAINIGTTAVTNLYVGTTQVWP